MLMNPFRPLALFEITVMADAGEEGFFLLLFSSLTTTTAGCFSLYCSNRPFRMGSAFSGAVLSRCNVLN